jgi:hypothetical protein
MPARYRCTNIREAFQEIEVIQYCIAESFSVAGKVDPRIGQDLLKLG